MMHMLKRLLGLAAVVGLIATAPSLSQAATIVGTEGPDGFVGDIFAGTIFAGFGPIVASDGELPFHPFGATFDVSDAVQFNQPEWILDPTVALWKSIVDPANVNNPTWVLAAADVNENNTISEPAGKWTRPGFFWTDAALAFGPFQILRSDGSVSDTITIGNDANNNGFVIFQSDGDVPEPASLTLLGIGIASVIGYGSRKRKTAVA